MDQGTLAPAMSLLTLDKATLYFEQIGQTSSNKSQQERAALIAEWSSQVTGLKQLGAETCNCSTSTSTPPLTSGSSSTTPDNTIEVEDGDDEIDDDGESTYSHMGGRQGGENMLDFHCEHVTSAVCHHCCLEASRLLMNLNRRRLEGPRQMLCVYAPHHGSLVATATFPSKR